MMETRHLVKAMNVLPGEQCKPHVYTCVIFEISMDHRLSISDLED